LTNQCHSEHSMAQYSIYAELINLSIYWYSILNILFTAEYAG